MGGLDQLGDDDSGTVFRDTIMLALAGFVSIVILLLPFINPKAKDAVEAAKAPGNVIIEAQWGDRLDADVDLWVQAPGDMPVGYSNKSGTIFNLLRDDLGKARDVTDNNYEVAYSRGTPAGEYIINVHMYRGIAASYPIAVEIVASVRDEANGSTQQLIATTVQLRHENQEVTAFRFRLDNRGHLVPGSINSLPYPLRAGGKSS